MLKDINVYLNPFRGMFCINNMAVVEDCKNFADIIHESLTKAIIVDKLFDIEEIMVNPCIDIQVSWSDEADNRRHEYFVTRLCCSAYSVRSIGMLYGLRPANYELIGNTGFTFAVYGKVQ